MKHNDVQAPSEQEMINVIAKLASELYGKYGEEIKVFQDPVDDMWIIFNPKTKITINVAENLEKLYETFLDEYMGLIEYEYRNVSNQFEPTEVN
jgi:hypothetical protein